jgi:hypothetical protein
MVVREITTGNTVTRAHLKLYGKRLVCKQRRTVQFVLGHATFMKGHIAWL